MDHDIFQLGVEFGKAMFVLRDPSRMIQDQAHDLDDLSSRATRILRLELAKTAVNNHIIVVVREKLAFGVGVGH